MTRYLLGVSNPGIFFFPNEEATHSSLFVIERLRPNLTDGSSAGQEVREAGEFPRVLTC